MPCHRKASASQAQKWHLSPPPGSPRSEGAGLSVQLRLRGEKERSGMEIPNLRYTKLFTFYIFLDCSKFPNETLASIFIVIKKKTTADFLLKNDSIFKKREIPKVRGGERDSREFREGASPGGRGALSGRSQCSCAPGFLIPQARCPLSLGAPTANISQPECEK